MRRIVLLAAVGVAACVCASARAETVWLCHPGKHPNPCTRGLNFTSVLADGTAEAFTVEARRGQPIDCFYVYPTVSLQHRGNSDLKIEIVQTDVAQLQASWFSPICRVFAPMYRQVTAFRDKTSDSNVAFSDVRAAWRDYLARENKGRGVVLIGHSQGSFMLKRLIQEEIEDVPKLRRRLVSAILLGGNIVVGNSSPKDGDFEHVPPCTSPKQLGCVVAFSTWDKPPPKNASFESVSNPARQHVLCVNPAAPGGGTADVTPLFMTTNFMEMGGVTPALMYAVNTDWVSYPHKYRARCVRRGSMSWLQVESVTRNDRRPTVRAPRGDDWGLHGLDVNLALYELVGLVGTQAAAYLQR